MQVKDERILGAGRQFEREIVYESDEAVIRMIKRLQRIQRVQALIGCLGFIGIIVVLIVIVLGGLGWVLGFLVAGVIFVILWIVGRQAMFTEVYKGVAQREAKKRNLRG